MSYPIKVLALADDNHPVCFVTIGAYYSNAAEFMSKCLLKPHDTTYQVKLFSLVDTEVPAKYDENTVMDHFDMLTCCSNPSALLMRDESAWRKREKAFAFCWKYGEEDFYV